MMNDFKQFLVPAAVNRLEQLARENGESSSFTAQEVAGPNHLPMHVGQHARAIVAAFNKRNRTLKTHYSEKHFHVRLIEP